MSGGFSFRPKAQKAISPKGLNSETVVGVFTDH
jgi:hypothetical protein